ncbi:hypothetical protein PanWU01x14_070640 [Parasponia andersonii]|uniref:Uncharacterized protein n=1 Tax=Parasponia andersonii TaxID=3476 RepID=A0A2P5DF34_PARAD|nr:hypothetical protein PanWU01x14_070640 [Parasponia andersonii]
MSSSCATTSHRRRRCPHARSHCTRCQEAGELTSSQQFGRHRSREAILVANSTCLSQRQTSLASSHRKTPPLTRNDEFS